MAELVDALDLGSGFARSEGSSPFIRILDYQNTLNSRESFIDSKRYQWIWESSHQSVVCEFLVMKTIAEFLQALIMPAPIAPEIIRAKAHELWKAQGGGIINPDANWQAAIEQIRSTEKIGRRSFF